MQPPEEKPADPQETNKRHRHEPQEHSEPCNNHGEQNNRNGNTYKENWDQKYHQNNQRRVHHRPGRHMPTNPCKGIVDNVDPTKRYFFINLIHLVEGNTSGNTSSRIFFHMDSRTQAQQQHRFADGDIVRIIECAHTPKGIKAVRIEIIA